MSSTWHGDTPPTQNPIGILGILQAILRGVPLFFLLFGGLGVLLIVRMVERPIFKEARPITPYITVFVCRCALVLMGLKLSVQGKPLHGQGAVVANHSSWLDIFVLNASKRIYFVSKSEVARWPGIGWLARATGTVFIERNRKKAASQTELFRKRLTAGHKLLFFPEGTSSDGARVLPFKSTLFAAFFDPSLRKILQVQPVSVSYQAPTGKNPQFFGWWGDMDFGSHLFRVLAEGHGGKVRVYYHPTLNVRDYADRKSLASDCETAVRKGFEASGKVSAG